MTIEELEGNLATLAESRQQATDEAAALVPGLLDGLREEAVHWIQKEVTSAIKSKSERFNSLTDEEYRAMKVEVEALTESILNRIGNAFDGIHTWLHSKVSDPSWQLTEYSSRGAHHDFLHDRFRDLVSGLGPILRKYGLLEAAYWETRPGQVLRYKTRCSFRERLRGLDEGYQDAVHRIEELERSFRSTKKSLDQKRALDRWSGA